MWETDGYAAMQMQPPAALLPFTPWAQEAVTGCSCW